MIADGTKQSTKKIQSWYWCAHPRREWFVLKTPAEEGVVLSETRDDWFGKNWFMVPAVRYAWGEEQPKLHAGASELLLDLIFVGVAYRVGSVVKAALTDGRETGIYLGLLHGLAAFLAAFQCWSYMTANKAKYSYSSKLHTILDMANHLVRCQSSIPTSPRLQSADAPPRVPICAQLLCFAAMGIVPSNGLHSEPEAADHYNTSGRMLAGEGAAGSSGSGSSAADADALAFMYVLYPMMLALLLWLCRFGEMAYLAACESVRRESMAELVIGMVVLGMWAGAAYLITHDPTRVAEVWAAALLWLGNLWWNTTRTLVPLLHCGVPVERSLVCPHHGYTYHRTHEFMFLMLGEAVLQIVIAAPPASSTVDEREWFIATRATALGGFVLAVCLMHTFSSIVTDQLKARHEVNTVVSRRVAEEKTIMSQIEQNSKDLRRNSCMKSEAHAQNMADHRNKMITSMNMRQLSAIEMERDAQTTIRRWVYVSAIELFLWQFNAVAVLLVGASLKMAVYDPLQWAEGRWVCHSRGYDVITHTSSPCSNRWLHHPPTPFPAAGTPCSSATCSGWLLPSRSLSNSSTKSI